MEKMLLGIQIQQVKQQKFLWWLRLRFIPWMSLNWSLAFLIWILVQMFVVDARWTKCNRDHECSISISSPLLTGSKQQQELWHQVWECRQSSTWCKHKWASYANTTACLQNCCLCQNTAKRAIDPQTINIRKLLKRPTQGHNTSQTLLLQAKNSQRAEARKAVPFACFEDHDLS